MNPKLISRGIVAGVMFLSIFLLGGASRADEPIDWSSLTLSKTVKLAAPSTVTVVCLKPLEGEDLEEWEQLDPDIKSMFRRVNARIALGEKWFEPISHGSGFVIDDQGHIVTNDHVVASLPGQKVHYGVSIGKDPHWHPARLVGTDPATDIAVIQLEGIRPGALEWGDSEALEQGDIVLAIGTPQDLALRQTVTMGVVSATGRSLNGLIYEDFIQTDASINGGNSGGPLVNLRGEVVGVNQSILLGMVTGADGSIAHLGDGMPLRASGNIGLGMSVPSKLARKVAEELIEFGRVRRGFLGVKLGEMDRAAVGMGAVVRVTSVLPNSPAAASGIKEGDGVVAFQEQPISSARQLHLAVSLAEPGTLAELTLLREGRPLKKEVALGDLEKTRYAAIGFDPFAHEPVGIDGIEIRAAQNGRQEFLVISRVDPRSPAAKAGITAPSLIEKVAGIPVSNFDEFTQIASTSVQDGFLLFTVRPFSKRGLGQARNVSLPVSQ